MISEETIIHNFMSAYKAGTNTQGHTGMTLGVVIDTDDPLQMGRLRVFCPSYNDDPKLAQYVPWAVYASPFAGSINNTSYTRGAGADANAIPPAAPGISTTTTTPQLPPTPATSEGAIAYGMNMVGELGAHMLVGCVDGDYRRRFWIASVPQHQETNTLHTGRWIWGDGKIEGPLTSDNKPLQPLYDNMRVAFQDKKDSAEWKSRAADYQISAVRDDAGQIPNSKKPNTDQTNAAMIENETDEWIKDAIGAHGYDWTGFKNVGAFLASRTFGISSPGNHAFVMDDRPFNNRIRLRTTTGHQLLLDDTNERIYLATNKGNSWVEMDSNGNVDIHSSNRVSIAAASDINLTSYGSIRFFAAESIHMYAGHNLNTDSTTQVPLDQPPAKGEIRMQSERDFHLTSMNIRHKSFENSYHEVGVNKYDTVGDSHFTTVQNDSSTNTVAGDHMVSSGKSIFASSVEDIKHFAQGKASFASVMNAEMHSFTGTTSVSASQTTIIKSMNSDVDMQAGVVSGSGSIKSATPTSQHIVGTDGIHASTSGAITNTSGSEVSHIVTPGYTPPTPTSLHAGLMGIGVSNIIKISSTDIQNHAALGDIIHKTSILGHSYNTLSEKVDTIASDLDLTNYQMSLLTTAVSTAISALSGSFSIPFSFNIPCLTTNLFNLLPPGLLSAFGSLDALNAALAALGHAATTLEGLVSLLSGNTSLLTLLGLDPSMIFSVDFSISACVTPIPQFGGTISVPDAGSFVSVALRELIDKIYQNSGTFGPEQTPPPYPEPQPCPFTPAPPNLSETV